jgi:hypothetical protein
LSVNILRLRQKYTWVRKRYLKLLTKELYGKKS